MDIFVISLARSPDRKEMFEKYNSQHIDKYTYFEAVDGQTLNLNSLTDEIITKGSINYTLGAVGSALSHLRLWEKCIELNRPILIMEDDAIVSHEFEKHLDNLMKKMKNVDYDIIQLSYNFDSVLCYKNTVYEQCNCLFNQTKMTDIDILNFINSDIDTSCVKLIHSFGASAYILSPKGAKIFKEKCFPLNNTILNIPFLRQFMCYTVDCLMNTLYKDISAYICINPFVVTPHISDSYKSLIK